MMSDWPTIDRPPVALPPLVGIGIDLWITLVDLAEALPGTWTLIGAQMVLLHALEHGASPNRPSADLDALVNVRAVTKALPQFVHQLEEMDFEEDGASPDNLAHRYKRGNLLVDVLAPEGLGANADLRTRPPGPQRTLEVPGGTQALHRTELLPVSVGGRVGHAPRPSLLGALISKAVSVDVDDVPEAQRQDLALLLSLIVDPFALVEQLRPKDRERLRHRRELLDRSHPAWGMLSSNSADTGHAALAVLVKGSNALDRPTFEN